MPLPVLYLVKCSISLSIVWIFYQLLLRRLTFYNMNRWYLLGYSLLSFFIPCIDLGPILEKDPARPPLVIRFIPAIGDYKGPVLPLTPQAASYNPWSFVLAGLALGAIVLLARLLVRWRSLWMIRQKARLIGHDGLRIYQVDEPIIPFSFGGAIYINRDLHSEKEWEEIILHEYVHIRQRHSLDILFAEGMSILNWYNPFVWLLRSSIRQNLEFIADQKVLDQGMDRKRYQYHLLKVIGEPRYRLANNFNFSSLKKRIIMMNTIKTARVHLVKFLFILPLITFLLVAFRGKYDGLLSRQKTLMINQAGIVANVNGYQPLAGVKVIDIFQVCRPYPTPGAIISCRSRSGRIRSTSTWNSKKRVIQKAGPTFVSAARLRPGGQLQFAMMLKDGENQPAIFIPPYMGPEPPMVPSYSDAQAGLRETMGQIDGLAKWAKMAQYLPEVSLIYTTEDKTKQIVFKKDGQVEKYGYPGTPAVAELEKKYGELPGLFKGDSGTVSKSYSARWAAIAAAAEKTFHTANPSVRHIIFPGDSRVIAVPLSGQPEIYDMDNADPKERPSFEKLYGKLPAVVPPPFLFTHTGTLAN